MGNMVVGIMAITGQIEMTQLEMADCQILWIEDVMDTCIILVLVLTNIMIFIVIILTGGLIGDTFQMNLRNKSHLILMET